MRNVLLISTLALGFGGACSRGVLLYETTPVIVQANPPAQPAPAPPVIVEPIVVRDAIHFDTNRDTIKQESLAVLDDVANQIKAHPELVKIRVEGHTDNVGKRAENLTLSRRRAIAVREYLITKGGIDAERLLAEGYGPDNPISNNENEIGRAKNRRVAFTVLDRTDTLGSSQNVVSYGGNQ
jgi:outer membrane protein OmpA-like peptidoglycan-associated protein